MIVSDRGRCRVFVFVLSLILVVSGHSSVLGSVQIDRYEQIFDVSHDGGHLTAQFLKLTTRNDAKSGDSTILTSPDKKIMVIDTGNPTCFVDVDNALKAMGVRHIDYLVASHPHSDHVGAMAELIRSYDVAAVYTSGRYRRNGNTPCDISGRRQFYVRQ